MGLKYKNNDTYGAIRNVIRFAVYAAQKLSTKTTFIAGSNNDFGKSCVFTSSIYWIRFLCFVPVVRRLPGSSDSVSVRRRNVRVLNFNSLRSGHGQEEVKIYFYLNSLNDWNFKTRTDDFEPIAELWSTAWNLLVIFLFTVPVYRSERILVFLRYKI